MFVHQDVCISSNTWLEKAEEILNKIPNLGIAGVAGRKDRDSIITNITHGEESPRAAGNVQSDFPTAVQTVDECLFIIPYSVFSELQFDEEVCNDWHLYAVDYSLSVSQKGLGVYVLPLPAHHMSVSKSLSTGQYHRTLKGLMRKHRNSNEYIYATTGVWNTHKPILFQRIIDLIISGLNLIISGLRKMS
jgi:hypothetical protein